MSSLHPNTFEYLKPTDDQLEKKKKALEEKIQAEKLKEAKRIQEEKEDLEIAKRTYRQNMFVKELEKLEKQSQESIAREVSKEEVNKLFKKMGLNYEVKD